MEKHCDIIIPVYNALSCLKECIKSVIKNTDLQENGLIIVEDKSPDPNVIQYLKKLEKETVGKNLTILYNEQNLGFVKTVNRAMRFSKKDVVLLNSDTEVAANWLKNIEDCAYSDKTIATVTALSNNATLVSAPIGLQANKISEDYTFEQYAKLVEECSYKDYPELPTAHGFCMFIKREVLDTIGFFDEESFGKGYGEENDFSFRCLDFGYKNVLCDNVYVLHKESMSFQGERKQLVTNNLKTLHERYPAYTQKIDLWCRDFPINYICKNIEYAQNLKNRTNILFLIHDFTDYKNHLGGTTLHCVDIIQGLRNKYNFHVLYPENGVYKIISFFEKSEEILTLPGVVAYSTMSLNNKAYKQMVKTVLEDLNISVVHVHHMIGHYMDIIDLCKEHEIRSIISLHDFYALCPTINMLYNMEKYCGELEDKDCGKCLYNKQRLANNIVPVWQKRWKEFLEQFDKVITPSQSTKDIIEKQYSSLNCLPIEHGLKIEKRNPKNNEGKMFNIAFIGVMAKHKGGQKIIDLLKITKNTNIKYHIFGQSEYEELKKDKQNYTYHGKYKREDLEKLFVDNQIDLVCNFSICPETYSYTLTETIALGIPVLSFDIGAVAERIKKYQFGWVINENSNAKEIIEKLEMIKNNKQDYMNKLDMIEKYEFKKVEEMVIEYANLYRNQASRNIIKANRLLKKAFTKNISTFNPQLEEILNSRRWKLISRVQIPEKMKKIVRKVFK